MGNNVWLKRPLNNPTEENKGLSRYLVIFYSILRELEINKLLIEVINP